MTWRSSRCRCALPWTAAGLVGADGATHAGSFDIAYLTALPNFVIMAPSDEAELTHMVATAARISTTVPAPSAIRAARARAWQGRREGIPLEIGKGRDRQRRLGHRHPEFR